MMFISRGEGSLEQLFNSSGNRRGYCAHPKDAHRMWNSEDGLFQRQVALLFLGTLRWMTIQDQMNHLS